MNKSKDFDFFIVFNCLLVAKIHFYSKKRPKNTKTLDNVFFGYIYPVESQKMEALWPINGLKKIM